MTGKEYEGASESVLCLIQGGGHKYTGMCVKVHQALPLRITLFAVCMLYLNTNLKKKKDKRNEESMEERRRMKGSEKECKRTKKSRKSTSLKEQQG